MLSSQDRTAWPSLLLFIVSAFTASTVICFAMDTVHKNVINISSNDTVLKDQLNVTVPSKIGRGGGGGGWWSYGWGWGSGGGDGGSGGGGGGGGGGCWWGCRGRHHRHGRRERMVGPIYGRRLYRVGEYARCAGRNRCRGMRLLCPMYCDGPCFYDCESNCRAHCTL